MQSAAAKSFPSLVPPDGWAVVESGIYRATSLAQTHVSFLKLTGVRTVVNLSTAQLRLAGSLEASGIRVFQPCATQGEQRSQISDEIAKEALQFVLEPAHQPLALTHSTKEASGSLDVAALVGCLRRLQHWALTAILYEFKLFAPKAPMYDVSRQFIERFDVSLVTLPAKSPEWLMYEEEVYEEELSEPRGDDQSDRFFYQPTSYVPLASDRMPPEQRTAHVIHEED
mmetsp:Transcript_25633/g.57502  ORF Transcript_25633/g.57502 Transcript_25633/m.57502 type:complete len:227 (+) Transcript_25633:107-787(+)|eukprot:CAMPEP_0172623996 /NCGR_PEP_ID=MMETSP1068-20121228/133097_1 /TAXON_ID=35684 /ORGANISM="Pseudopedinella elastica, Strain CCMP716" /LENGTH=226 /DNA_ID=CAMNT_0013432773 /DNA_START=81 /DNA_END=761 /DNA_ORIENTATION=+